jgi:hypothetical protein
MSGATRITPDDIRAIMDVLADVDEASDALSVEDAMALREALVELATRVRTSVGLIDSQLVSVLESPREFNGQLYEVRPDGKWRPDHNRVKAEVKRHSVVDVSTGELRSAPDAVERCMSLLYSLYVAPSAMPKVGALEGLGLDKADVGHYERAGQKVSVKPVMPT